MSYTDIDHFISQSVSQYNTFSVDLMEKNIYKFIIMEWPVY